MLPRKRERCTEYAATSRDHADADREGHAAEAAIRCFATLVDQSRE
jgi:hypothetical protein